MDIVDRLRGKGLVCCNRLSAFLIFPGYCMAGLAEIVIELLYLWSVKRCQLNLSESGLYMRFASALSVTKRRTVFEAQPKMKRRF